MGMEHFSPEISLGGRFYECPGEQRHPKKRSED